MGQLVTLAHGELVAPRIQIGKNPLAPPLAEHHHQSKCNHHHGGDDKEHARVDATQKENAHGDHRDHHEGAHVGFGQQQHAHHRNGRGHRQHGTKEALFDFHLADHIVCGIQQYGEFRQFRGLKVHDAQRNPAARTIDALAYEGQQHQYQQQQRRNKQPGRQFFPSRYGNLKGYQRRHKGHGQRGEVAQQEMRMRVAGEFWVVWHRNRRRIDHDQTPHQQGHGNPDQRLVKASHARRWRCQRALQGLAAKTDRQRVSGGFADAREPAEKTRGSVHSTAPCSWPRA